MLPGDPIVRDFGNFRLRSQVFVNMALGFTKGHEETKLAVTSINFRYKYSYAALLAVIILELRLFSECGKRLLFCLLDVIV